MSRRAQKTEVLISESYERGQRDGYKQGYREGYEDGYERGKTSR